MQYIFESFQTNEEYFPGDLLGVNEKNDII